MAKEEARCALEVFKPCSVCQCKAKKERIRPPLKSIQVGGPLECIGMDFNQMDISHSGNRYTLVLQDYLTKWPKVYPVADGTASTVAKCLTDFIWKHRVPVKTIHDRAAEFVLDMCRRQLHH